MRLSQLAESLIGSEIVKLNGEIKEKIKQGKTIFNFTVGDFDPSIFPIPIELEQEIIEAYKKRFTNYPAAEGNLDLREGISTFLKTNGHRHFSTDEILVSSGGRPLIYAAYQAICDQGDKIIYALPSWNNNHYTHLVGGRAIEIKTLPENKFMPTAKDIEPFIQEATLISLCTPQNPTGTTMSKETLSQICEMIVAENKRRKETDKKLYLLFDQMYWQLTFGDIQHYHPLALNSEMKDYTIYIDAISKMWAATGVRVGWAMGPSYLISKMKAILTHLGAWAPMAEQKAVAQFLLNQKAIENYNQNFKSEIEKRLQLIYDGLVQLKNEGFPIDVIAPEAAIYLTIKIDATGKKNPAGMVLKNQKEVTSYILDEAGLAIVPFSAFGDSADSPWYRLSVGTCKLDLIDSMFKKLKEALGKLN